MRTCQYCRTENRADATYCNSCGALLPGATPAAAASAVYAGAAAPAAPRPINATGRLPANFQLRGRYLILKNVGQGGMAAVYKATDLQTKRIVAIKEMSQDGLSAEDLRDALASFRTEAEMLARLRHANLPRVYESFSEQARHYLVMEFIEGQTLEQRQQAAGGGALPEGDVLGWARQVSAVLTYLHDQRPPIIFRDLKPANIMLAANGQIKLIDFGIARAFAPGRAHDTQVLGTPGFAPPEQYGKAQTDARADVYALGCTLYQLLTGYDPATTPFNLPPMSSRNPKVSPAVQRAVERATKLDRESRYPTVEAFARELLVAAPPASKPAPKVTLPHPAVHPPAASAARAAPTMAASVVVTPHKVDFGRLIAGQRGTQAITVSGMGGVTVRGQIAALSPWVRLDRSGFDGKSTVITIAAETSAIGQPGAQRSDLQIICDQQQLFVPVTVEVAPAPSSAKPKTAPASTRAPRAVPSKYTRPAPRRGRSIRFLTAMAVGLGLSASALALFQQLLTQHVIALPLTAPLALGALLVASALAGVGALAGSGGPGWRGRAATSLWGGLAGLAVFLVSGGGWLWAGAAGPAGPVGLLTATVALPRATPLVAPLLASAGGALGADPVLGQWLLAVATFVARYSRYFVTTAAVVAGAWAGYALTAGLFFGCLTPLAMIGGALLGFWAARIVGVILPRPPAFRRYRPPAYRARAPRMWP